MAGRSQVGVQFIPVEDWHPYEREAIAGLELDTAATAEQYAHILVNNERRFHNGHLRVGAFLTAVETHIQPLIASQPPEDIAVAHGVLVAHGKELAEQYAAREKSGYMSWILKVRHLARFTMHSADGSQPIATAFQTDTTLNSVKFWQQIYIETATNRDSLLAFETYVLGPGIESKDSEILMSVVDDLQQKTSVEVFSSKGKSPQALVRNGYDGFERMVRELEAGGWKNAAFLRTTLDGFNKRDMPLHSLIITLANQVTSVLNRQTKGVPLSKLRQAYPSDAGEAINRCLHLVFEYGDQPEGHDPLNFLLYGQILGSLFSEAEVAVRAKKA